MLKPTLAAFAEKMTMQEITGAVRSEWSIGRVKTEILSGFTVSLALVPEAVAFAFVAGVNPLVGLYAAFIVGLITAIMGGRPGMISGATGALAVVMVALVADHGVEYLFATVLLMGILQIGAGVFKRCFARQNHAPAKNQRKYEKHQNPAEQAPFLRHSRKDEVGVRFGQVIERAL